jgi:hypothetical protein
MTRPNAMDNNSRYKVSLVPPVDNKVPKGTGEPKKSESQNHRYRLPTNGHYTKALASFDRDGIDVSVHAFAAIGEISLAISAN